VPHTDAPRPDIGRLDLSLPRVDDLFVTVVELAPR
jgi:hypothetical protein